MREGRLKCHQSSRGEVSKGPFAWTFSRDYGDSSGCSLKALSQVIPEWQKSDLKDDIDVVFDVDG
jgi:hypothetical protein